MTAPFAPPRIDAERRPDRALLLRSTEPLAGHPVSVVHSFREHAAAHPDRLLVAERDADGGWARTTWGEAREQADRLAQGLLDRGLADRPVLVLSGNSRLHLLLALAAMTVGGAPGPPPPPPPPPRAPPPPPPAAGAPPPPRPVAGGDGPLP